MRLTHISLFTGIGGIDIAAEWAGFETVLMVENNAYCQKVLKKHWPDVPILEDIFNVNKETIQEALANATSRQSREQKARNGGQDTGRRSEEESLSLSENKGITRRKRVERNDDGKGGERRTNDGGSRSNNGSEGDRNAAAKLSPITLVIGGFPCQPVSQVGKRRGKEDDRWLWPEMLRVISEVRPTWVVAENVAGLLNMGFNDCVSDLESEGYETQSFLIPACAVNAPHRRDRIFIVGYSEHDGQLKSKVGEGTMEGKGSRFSSKVWQSLDDEEKDWVAIHCCSGNPFHSEWPGVPRVATGVKNRVDRLRALGNAVVPAQIYPLLKAIADIEL